MGEGSESLIHLVVIEGDVHILRNLLNSYLDVNIKERIYGRTPLHFAVRDGNYEIARLLLEKGADPEIYTKENLTALHIAVANQDLEMVELLIEFGANVNPRRKFGGKTPLHIAIEYNCYKITKLLLEEGALISDIVIRNTTLLHIAIDNGTSQLTELILNYLTNYDKIIDFKDRYTGKTPLVLAVEKRYYNVVKKLLQNGANALESYGDNIILEQVMEEGDEEMMTLFLQYNKHKEHSKKLLLSHNLHHSINTKHKKLVKLLLETGTSKPDERSCGGFTALHVAVRSGHKDIAKLCLDHGADVNAKTLTSNLTALYFAVRNLDIEMAQLLIDYGAKVNDIIGIKNTVLDIAVSPKCVWMINFLLENGAVADLKTLDLKKSIQIVKCVALMVSRTNCKYTRDNVDNIRKCAKFTELYDECLEEIDVMKTTKIIDNITFYHLLTKSKHALAAYCRNEGFPSAFKSSDYINKFPNYATFLKTNYRKAMIRHIVWNATLYSFDKLLGFKLPSICSDKISSYMTNDDCKKAISAAYDKDNNDPSYDTALTSFFNMFRVDIE